MRNLPLSLKKSIFLFALLGAIALEGLMLATSASKRVISRMKSRAEINVYLADGIDSTQVQFLLSFVKKLAGVKSSLYIDSEKAEQIFRKEYPDYAELLELYPRSPLPSEIRIKPHQTWSSVDLLGELAGKLGKLPGVEEVYYAGAWTARFEKLSLNFLRIMYFLTALALFFIVSFPFLLFGELKCDNDQMLPPPVEVFFHSLIGGYLASFLLLIILRSAEGTFRLEVPWPAPILLGAPVLISLLHLFCLKVSGEC